VRGIAEGVGRDDLQAATEAPLSFADEVVVLAEQA
jgi:3-oxoadipate CoA-transferase beta subunit